MMRPMPAIFISRIVADGDASRQSPLPVASG
jgi:hypothetical protein